MLLPFLSRHGFDWDAPPLSSIREEHRQELYLLDVLRQAGERLQEWNAEERRHVAAAALSLCEFQRRHHATENEGLFPAVQARLSARAALELQLELERFDAVPAHAERRAAVLALGAELIGRHLANDAR